MMLFDIQEFVACQTKDPGVLILSPFTGAAETMLESLLVNPYETTEMAGAIHRAICMPLDERELRMNLLRKRERTNNVDQWLQSFIRGWYFNLFLAEKPGIVWVSIQRK